MWLGWMDMKYPEENVKKNFKGRTQQLCVKNFENMQTSVPYPLVAEPRRQEGKID